MAYELSLELKLSPSTSHAGKVMDRFHQVLLVIVLHTPRFAALLHVLVDLILHQLPYDAFTQEPS